MRTGSSLFLRADGRWEARYQKGRDEQGRIVYGFVYGKTQDEAERKRSEAIRKLNPNADSINSTLASINPNVSVPVAEAPKKHYSKFKYDRFTQPLDNEQAALIDSCLAASDSSSAVAFYLSLHVGMSVSECAALRYSDIDLEQGYITVRNTLSADDENLSVIPTVYRCIPLSPYCIEFLKGKNVSNKNREYFVLTDTPELISNSKTLSSMFRRIIKSQPSLVGVTPMALRSTFICRCLESNINIESASAITGVDRNQLYKYFGIHIKTDVSAINRIVTNEKSVHRQLNLLILGAGSHGHNVRETAERLRIFQRISFLDDIAVGEDIIGKCSDCASFLGEYSCAFVAIGNNERRKYYADILRKCGFMLPTLIHPDTTVSKNAVIGEGTIIMAQATINAAVVGDCCIVASNALINYGAIVHDFSRFECGAMVMKKSEVPELTIVESGGIFRNKEQVLC